jgi:hypothetical protein
MMMLLVMMLLVLTSQRRPVSPNLTLKERLLVKKLLVPLRSRLEQVPMTLITRIVYAFT